MFTKASQKNITPCQWISKRVKRFYAAQFALLQKCYESISTLFMPLVSLYISPLNMKKLLVYLIFWGVVETNWWHEIAWDTHNIPLSITNAAIEEWFGPILIYFLVDVICSVVTPKGCFTHFNQVFCFLKKSVIWHSQSLHTM